MRAPLNPSAEQFAAFADEVSRSGGNVAPLARRLQNTPARPLRVFARLLQNSPYAFFLESAEIGETLGRYSITGANPRLVMSFASGKAQVKDAEGNNALNIEAKEPVEAIAQFAAAFRAPPVQGLPPCWGGAAGYLAYDCVHYWEPIGDKKPDEIGAPESVWMLLDSVVIFDHLQDEIYLVKSAPLENFNAAEVHQQGQAQLDALEKIVVEESTAADEDGRAAPGGAGRGKVSPPPSNFSREEYMAMVERVKKHIVRGDIFQAVPSQRFAAPLRAHPLQVYRALRKLNPSPYMFYLQCDNFTVAGSSPELMVHCKDGEARVRPIAGTRPRGANKEEDAALEKELLADEKERAEHMMLVDLGRNDIGRVAAAGSVRVPPEMLFSVEKYSHVMHIVSEVRGKLDEGQTPFDAMRATFPLGTLSGAPKVRAMQIINDNEPARRNLYGGLVGYWDYGGELMTCIVIRSFLAKGGRAYVQAGGGVVADSDPAAEYQESVNKAMAVLRAIALANEAAEAAESETDKKD